MRGDPASRHEEDGSGPDAISSPFGAELWSCRPRPTGVIHPERNRFLVTVSSVSEGEQRASVPVIDMWAPIVPSCEIIDDLRLGFPTGQLQYVDVFTKTSVSEEQFGDYVQGLRRTDDKILAALDDAAITRSIITGFDERSICGVTFVHNESIAALAERHPDRFIPSAGADIMRGG
jgi:hypothetical protein